MLRSRPVALCAALLLGLALLAPAVTAQNFEGMGDPCTSREQCREGFLCAYNVCFDPAFVGGVDALPDGTGNVCSATECCQTGLVCWLEGNLCLPPTAGITELKCGGGSGPSVPPPPPPQDGDEDDGGQQPGGDGGLGRNEFCDNGQSCAGDLLCVNNLCLGGSSERTPNGIGNACNATNCCAEGQMCLRDDQQCALTLLGASTLSCDTSQPPTDGDGDGDGGGQDDDGIGKDQFCDNGQRCRRGLLCLGNSCEEAGGLQLPHGIGNACSRDNCCQQGQMCMQEGSTCAPTVPMLQAIPCDGAQPPAVDGILGLGGDLDDGNGNGAGAMHASVLLVTFLVALALGAAM